MRSSMFQQPRRISSKLVGSMLYSSGGRPATHYNYLLWNLPRTPSGKLSKRTLRESFRRQAAAAGTDA